MRTRLLCSAIGLGFLLQLVSVVGAPRVELMRVPNGGIQPQAVVDGQGTVHLIYFKGEAKAGDIFYVRLRPGADGFSKPMPVNSRAGSAIAVGTIRGAQLALGRHGRVHVAWNGSSAAEPSGHEGAPMLYTRLNDAGTAFEPERDLMRFTGGLDGGGSVAADDQGTVYVMWHGSPPGNTQGEAGRAVFLARSVDDGKTFARERPVNPKATGACGCCGMRAFADGAGNLFALYRAASEKVNRDEILLVSRDRGESFAIASSHPWNIPSCPMSSAFFSESKAGTLAAWETTGQVYFASVNPLTLFVAKPVAPPGVARRKHPVAVGNAKGEVLLAWAEDTGWQRGGSLAWQVFSATGQPTDDNGRAAGGVPVWGLPAAVARGDGFVIFH